MTTLIMCSSAVMRPNLAKTAALLKYYGVITIYPINNVTTCSYEVNMAAVDSPLTIIKHSQPSLDSLRDTSHQELRVS